MTQQEIIEGNKLIAEFMHHSGLNSLAHEFQKMHGLQEKNYNNSWDWLIPVINKIYESDWYYKWKDTSGQFEKEVFINTKFIETTWEQVVEFIKWYNENKNK